MSSNSKAVANGVTGRAECGNDFGAPDGAPPSGRAYVAEGCCRWGATGSHVLDSGEESEDSADMGVDGAVVPDGSPTCTILMISKCEQGKVDTLEVG